MSSSFRTPPQAAPARRSGPPRLQAFLAVLALLCPALAACAAMPSSSQGCRSSTGCAELRLDDLIQRPVGPQGVAYTPRTLALNGQAVCTQGHMVIREQAQTGRFLLTRHLLRMSEHADGEADDLPPDVVTVLLPPAQQEALPVQGDARLHLCGRLLVGREEGPDGRVSWIRLQLEQAVPELPSAPTPAGEVAGQTSRRH